MIHIKRIYDRAVTVEGEPILVDHLWPRGIKKEAVKHWNRDVAPSDSLRKWFGHEPAKWEEFQRRYFAELDEKLEAWEPLLQAARQGDIVLLYSTRETEHNNAVALKTYLEKKLKRKSGRKAHSLVAA
jgi:uncharacterized protein YeaO (DUF488 family)